MEAEQAARRCRYMWAKLGRILEARAYERAETGNGLDRIAALEFAKAAEACFWQATGDCIGINLSDLS